jgi:glucosamine kinase
MDIDVAGGQVTSPSPARRPPASAGVVIGIDAGGSATRVQAVRDGQLVYTGAGGPGNPMAADEPTVRASYRQALDGCPPATRVAACVAGTGGRAQQAHIEDLLADFFPAAVVRVVPDCVGALLAAPDGTDACVVAGTGSVICSAAPDGGYALSGGRGWILGDHGSAARLGRAALEHYAADPAAVPAPFAAAVAVAMGEDSWRRIAAAVSSAPDPARLLARAAPLLTAAAEQGADWAAAYLDREMAALAATTARHIEQHVSRPAADRTGAVRIALAGGVWASPAAQTAFAAALNQASQCPVIVARSPHEPIAGATRLAATLAVH